MARNLITDVPGIAIGHADDARLASGVTVALFDRPAVASVFLAGGAPAGRDQENFEGDRAVERIDAIVLSGGSGFGLDAATGAQAWLREQGRGLPVGSARVPIVPSAVLFDLLNGGDKDWGRFPPYRDLAYTACAAARPDLALGSVGAGLGATTVDLKGGIGSASARLPGGATVGAIAAVNAIGSAIVGEGPHFWAGPFERDGEFGGLGMPAAFAGDTHRTRWKGGPGTTLAIVATDARLTKGQAKRLAIMASTGLAKSLRLAFGPMDGDTVFAVSTRDGTAVDANGLTELGVAASDCLARAVARGVYEATVLPFSRTLPAWKDISGQTVALIGSENTR